MSFAAALTKRDVRSAVLNLFTFRFGPRADHSESEQNTTQWSARTNGSQWTSARSLISGGGDSMANASHSFRASFASRRDSESSQTDATSATVSFRTMYAHSRNVSSLTVLSEVDIERAETNSSGEGGRDEHEEAPQSGRAGNEKDGESSCTPSFKDVYRSDGRSDFDFEEEKEERIKEASISIEDANCTGDDTNVEHIGGRRHSVQTVPHRERQVQLPYFKDDLALWQA